MSPTELSNNEESIRKQADTLLEKLQINNLLSKFGDYQLIGSYNGKVMVKPDLDFVVYANDFDVGSILSLGSELYALAHVFQLEFYDHERKGTHKAYYWGATLIENEVEWRIDITFCKPEDSEFDPRIDKWFANITDEQRLTILALKHELIQSDRYKGAHSKPPESFRSINVYEAVFEGGVQSVKELEKYFSRSNNQ